MTLTEAAPVSRREQAKDGRRARVVDAAQDLLREGGTAAVSVKAVAARAAVSVSTLYNLFASKEAILAGVYARDFAIFREKVLAAPGDAIERIMAAVDIATAFYGSDPAFYKAIYAQRGSETPGTNAVFGGPDPRVRFLPDLVADALAKGMLRAGADPALLGEVMNQALGGAVSDWIAGRSSVERLNLTAKLAHAALLATFAAEAEAPRLKALIGDLHKRLSQTGAGA